jgi:shikimate dehydrogenase
MNRYALLGRALSHSFSKDFFTDYFLRNQIDASYTNCELDQIEDFKTIQFDFQGFNVTIPYKETIIPYLDSCDEVALEVGAVNTIKVIDNKLIGYNTDVIGFANMIKPFLTNKHEKALIMGKGGASKAVTYVLENLGIDCFYLTRNKQGNSDFLYEEMNDFMAGSFKLIVNTTPVGMYPNVAETIDLPYEAMTAEHLLIDLIYNPEETEFLRNGRLRGAQTLNGLSMLKEQALASYKIWNE